MPFLADFQLPTGRDSAPSEWWAVEVATVESAAAWHDDLERRRSGLANALDDLRLRLFEYSEEEGFADAEILDSLEAHCEFARTRGFLAAAADDVHERYRLHRMELKAGAVSGGGGGGREAAEAADALDRALTLVAGTVREFVEAQALQVGTFIAYSCCICPWTLVILIL